MVEETFPEFEVELVADPLPQAARIRGTEITMGTFLMALRLDGLGGFVWDGVLFTPTDWMPKVNGD